MLELLAQAGFNVQRCPWWDEASEVLRGWLEDNISES